jgi:hypothetical protein
MISDIMRNDRNARQMKLSEHDA